MLNTIRRPVIMVGPDGLITYANADAEDFFRSSASILARSSLTRFVPFGSPLLTLVEQVRERQAPVNEYRVDVSSPRLGLDKIVDLYVAPVPELPGSVVVMFQERSMADKIDRQMTHRGAARSVTGLAAMLAHEIKNPLSGIRGAAQLLESGLSDEDRALTRLITDETDRIVSLVDRMEVFSDERPIDRYPVNIHVVLDHVKAIAKQRICQPHQDLRGLRPVAAAGLCQPRPARAGLPQSGEERRRGDRHRPDGRDHAVDRLPARHPRRRAGQPGPRLAAARILVRDNGAGVSEDILPILFDPFITTKPNGSGLGLALVAKIVGEHGGIIECDSSPRGTSFRILMPAWKEAGRQPRRRDRSTAMNVRGNILVADDDAAIRTVLNQALTRVGHEVRVTSNASTLWRWVAAGEGDLVITDVVMPDENAFDMLPRIKKARPELPVIVMSAQNTFMTAIRASETGAYEYLPKPFDLTELHQHRQPRAGRAEAAADRAAPGRAAGRDAAGRPLGRHAGHLPHARPHDADRPDGDDLRRVRHRQGAGGARAA